MLVKVTAEGPPVEEGGGEKEGKEKNVPGVTGAGSQAKPINRSQSLDSGILTDKLAAGWEEEEAKFFIPCVLPVSEKKRVFDEGRGRGGEAMLAVKNE